jgi:hypothetical protein
VELNDRESSYHYFLYDLPNGVEQANTVIIASSFRKEDDDHPCHLSWDRSILPDRFQQSHKRPPMVPYPLHSILQFFALYVCKPLLQVLSFHSRCTHRATIT